MAKILIVDDRAINRECLSLLLGHAGHCVTEAAGGVEALEAARAGPPDLVITDVLMPGMDGCELFKQFKADAALADIPILFYTAAFRLGELTDLAARHGNAIVLAKPSDPKAILAAVARVLNTKEAPLPAPAASCSADQALGLRLATLLELSLALAGEPQPEKLLQLACRGARDILNTPYVALALVDEAGCLQHLETTGLADNARSALGSRPADARFLSAFHPPAALTLVQAIQSPNRRYGWLYIAGGTALAAESEQIAVNLAAQLGLAWENLQSQQLIADREQRLSRMIESAMDAIVTIDESQCIHLFNSAAETMFGYPRQAMLGQTIERLVPERFRAAHAGYVTQFGLSGQKKKKAMAGFTGVRADGTEFPIEAAISTVHENGVRLFTLILRDITERLRNEAEIKRLNADLERRVEERTVALAHANEALLRSNQELQHFAHVAAHDLQTPLRSISSFTQLLRLNCQGRLGERAEEWLNQVADNARRMRTLIADLLAYSRLGALERPFEPTDMRRLFNEVTATLAGPISEAGAEVSCGDLPTLLVDRSQMAQLLQNLIDNGIKYNTGTPPRIGLSCARGEEGWVFSVADNGIGIDPRYHARIFEIFQRLHGHHTYSGTGIGLAICRRVVERHGGRLWVESSEGAGSTFHFTLPSFKGATS